MTSKNNQNVNIEEIFLDAEKLQSFIIGASAIIGRIEVYLGLPKMSSHDYVVYGSSSDLMSETAHVGGKVLEYEGGFFGWIYDKIIKPVYNKVIKPVYDNTLKPVVDTIVRPVIQNVVRPVLENPITQLGMDVVGTIGGPKAAIAVGAINGVNKGLKAVGLGDNVTNASAYGIQGNGYEGSAYRIEKGSAYRIEGKGNDYDGSAYRIQGQGNDYDGSAYRIQGSGRQTIQIPAQLRNEYLQGDDQLIPGELYRFGNKLMMYTDNGFIAPPRQIKKAILKKQNYEVATGGAYLDPDTKEVVISNNSGMLGSTNKCNHHTPMDFLQK